MMMNIRSLPKSLVESAGELCEAIALKSHIAAAKRAANSTKTWRNGPTEAQRLSAHAFPPNQDRIEIPIEPAPAVPPSSLVGALDQIGYTIHGDYRNGLAIKKGETKNPISIGKVLSRSKHPAASAAKRVFDNDTSRQGIHNPDGNRIVICRDPIAVGGMSTHQKWESCQTLGGGGEDENGEPLKKQEIGSQRHHVFDDIAAGTHVAYMVSDPADVDKHYAPNARLLLKPFHSVGPSGVKHTILRPASKVYGDEWDSFRHTVGKWANDNFPMREPEYHMDSTMYPEVEGSGILLNHSPEHAGYFKQLIQHVVDKQSGVPYPGITHSRVQPTPNRHQIEQVFSQYAKETPNQEHIDLLVSYPKTHALVMQNPHRQEKHELGMINQGVTGLNNYTGINPAINPEALKYPSAISLFAKKHLESASPNAAQLSLVARNTNTDSNTLAALYHRYPDDEKIRTGIIKNANTHRHIVDDYISNHKNPENTPYLVQQAVLVASPHIGDAVFSKFKENTNFDHLQYYAHSLKTILQQRPEYVKHYDPKLAYFAYARHTDTNVKSVIEKHFRDEDILHRVFSHDTFDPELAKHIATTNENEEIRRDARNRYLKLTGKELQND